MSSTTERVYEGSDFTVELEWVVEKPVVFVHIGIHKWSPSVGKHMLAMLKDIEKLAHDRGYNHLCAYNPAQTDRWKAFMEKFIKYPPLFYLENGHVVYGRSVQCL